MTDIRNRTNFEQTFLKNLEIRLEKNLSLVHSESMRRNGHEKKANLPRWKSKGIKTLFQMTLFGPYVYNKTPRGLFHLYIVTLRMKYFNGGN